jgi:hypothetical protein
LQYHILLNLVEDLKQKLIAERKKNLTLEANVREELCQVRTYRDLLIFAVSDPEYSVSSDSKNPDPYSVL